MERINATPFGILPPELILKVTHYLACDAIFALRLTSKEVRFLVPVKLGERRDNRILCPDHNDCSFHRLVEYRKRPEPGYLYCHPCQSDYPTIDFNSARGPACKQRASRDPSHPKEIVELPNRICSHHVSRLTKIVYTEFPEYTGWESRMGKLCVHCGNVWFDYTDDWMVEQTTTNEPIHVREPAEDHECECQSCPVLPARTYIRYANTESPFRTFQFWRKDVGKGERELFVKEHYVDEYGEGATRDLPVRFVGEDNLRFEFGGIVKKPKNSETIVDIVPC